MIILFSHNQKVKQHGVITDVITVPMHDCVVCQIYLTNTVIFSFDLVSAHSNNFLTFFKREFQRRGNIMLKL